MCGIVGLSFLQPAPDARQVAVQMSQNLAHRGPDSSGVYSCGSGRTHLGFRRLSIRDLRRHADQPMQSASGRTWVAFNGEIYNTHDLAARHCPGVRFRTASDTEVFLESFERHGPDILPDCSGMFAAAFYDGQSRTLSLVRDRMGKKPLYIYEADGFLAFGSELRAFRRFGLEPDPAQIPFFFQFGYFPAPRTFYRKTSQVLPGEVVTVRDGRIASRRRFHDPRQYAWGKTRRVDMEQLQHRLEQAVAQRTVADVPVGAFLSGGVDSALVASQLRGQADRRLPCFTVSLRPPRYDEASAARDTADQLQLPHHVIPVTEGMLQSLVSDYVHCYEQPFADSSGLPTMLLCEEVKKHVTVALSGDGGDEFFGGYRRYQWYCRALMAQRFPRPVRALMRGMAPRMLRRRGGRIGQLLQQHDEASLYAALVRCWTVGSVSRLLPDLAGADEEPLQVVRDVFQTLDADALSKAACFDAMYYIPDDLQVKLDRASMRVALEVRCPLLDNEVAALGAALATREKYRHGLKTVLRRLLAKLVPQARGNRPKHGFSVPLGAWLRGPLRPRVHDTLCQRGFRECGWVNPQVVAGIWDRFCGGENSLTVPVWMLFLLSHYVASSAENRPRQLVDVGLSATSLPSSVARRVA